MQPYQNQLTETQAAYLQKLLPFGYSFQQVIIQQKRQRSAKKIDESFTADYGLINKKCAGQKRQNVTSSQKSIAVEKEDALSSQKNVVKQSSAVSIENAEIKEEYKTKTNIDVQMLTAMLQRLKNHRSGNVFQFPVDPIKQGVPNYLQIIKQPMDLNEVERKLKNGIYKNNQQFHADIKKIINNSYFFNKKKTQYYTFTQEFQSNYFKICQQYLEDPSSFTSALKIGPNDNVELENLANKKKMESVPKRKAERKQKQQLKNETKKITLANQLNFRQRQKLFHKIYQLPQNQIINLLKIYNSDIKSKDWNEVEIDFAKLDDDKFLKIKQLLKQK